MTQVQREIFPTLVHVHQGEHCPWRYWGPLIAVLLGMMAVLSRNINLIYSEDSVWQYYNSTTLVPEGYQYGFTPLRYLTSTSSGSTAPWKESAPHRWYHVLAGFSTTTLGGSSQSYHSLPRYYRKAGKPQNDHNLGKLSNGDGYGCALGLCT